MVIAMRSELREAADVFAAASTPTRVRILKCLQVRPLRVFELAQTLQISQPTVSRHLQVLDRAGLVTARREAQWVAYSIAEQPASAVHMAVLWSIGQALEGDPQTLEDRRRLWETTPE